jgi:hypothetical protein
LDTLHAVYSEFKISANDQIISDFQKDLVVVVVVVVIQNIIIIIKIFSIPEWI